HPDVPTSTLIPRSTAARTTSTLTEGVDASTTRSVPSSSDRSLAEVSTAVTSKPSSSSITPRMMVPSLPVPPTSATRFVTLPVYSAARHGWRRRTGHGGSVLSMLELRPASVAAPESQAILTDYFALRAEEFPGGTYSPTFPVAAAFTPPAGIFLL